MYNRQCVMGILGWCLGLLTLVTDVNADELQHLNADDNSQESMLLFNGGDLSNWKQGGNWRVTEQAFHCVAISDYGDGVLLLPQAVPGDCEVVFEWKENGSPGVALYANPGLAVGCNIGVAGSYGASTFGASVDCCISGIAIRLHTRSILDETAVRETVSGIRRKCPARDFSKQVGEWNHCRIVSIGPRIQIWLNGNKAYDLELKEAQQTAGNGDDWKTFDAIMRAEWMGQKSKGLHLSVLAPLNEDDLRRDVQIRSLAVRRLSEAKLTPGGQQK